MAHRIRTASHIRIGPRIGPKDVAAVLLASMAAAVLIAIVMVVLGEYTKTRGRLFLTALSLSGFCLLALAPSVLARRPRRHLLGDVGLAAAGLGYILLIIGIWATPNSDAYWKSVAVVLVGAVSSSYVCLLMLPEPRLRLARVSLWVAAAAAGLVLALASMAIIAEIKAAPFWWAVVIIAIAEIAAGSSFPLLNRPLRQHAVGPQSCREGE